MDLLSGCGRDELYIETWDSVAAEKDSTNYEAEYARLVQRVCEDRRRI